MKLQDLIRFSFELVLPEKAVQALVRHVAAAPLQVDDLPIKSHRETSGTLRQIIEDIDTARHGGLTFGPDTIERMSVALDGAITAIPHPLEIEEVRALCEQILDIAADGVRDPERLKVMALDAFEKWREVQKAPMSREDVLSQAIS